MLCVSCADQWAELSWSLWCSSLPHSLQIPAARRLATLVSLEKLVSQSCWLQQTHTHTPPLSSPQQMDCCQNKDSLEELLLLWNQFPDERKHLITAANIPFIELVANAIRTQHRQLQISVLLTTLRAHGGRPTPAYSSVLAFSHVHADPRPSRCCRSRTPKP